MATAALHFSIEGEWLTDHCRDLILEGRWRHAERTLADGLVGISLDQVRSVLDGTMRLEGDNDLSLIPEDPTRGRVVAWRRNLEYIAAGLWRPVSQERVYRPYAVISDFGPDDFGPIKVGGWRTVPPVDRTQFYMRDKERDHSVMLDVPGYVGRRAVLFEYVEDPAPWLYTHASAQEAVDAFLSTGHDLDVDGASLRLAADVRADALAALVEYTPEAGNEEPEPAARPDFRSTLLAMMPAHMVEASAGVLAAMFDDEMNVRPEPDTELASKNGYITPDGRYWGCLFHNHAALAQRLLRWELGLNEDADDPEIEADKRGWLRVSFGPGLGFQSRMSQGKNPTKYQMDTMARLCERHGWKFPAHLMDQ